MNVLFIRTGGSGYTNATIFVARCPDVKLKGRGYRLTIFKNGHLLRHLGTKWITV